MDLDQLVTIWEANDAKINSAVKLNTKTLDLILSQKVKSSLNSLLLQRIIELSFHSIALIMLFAFLANNITQLTYAFSAIALIAFYGLIFTNCFKQIRIIRNIESNTSIVSMQKSLAEIQIHQLTFIRLSVLCIPTFLSYPIVVSKALTDLKITVFGDFEILKASNGAWWYAELIACLVLIPLGLWFYRQVTVKNIHKTWVAHTIKMASSRRVTNAIEYLNELEQLKQIK